MQRINEDIKNGRLRQMYLLYGEERYLRRQYEKRLQGALCAQGDEMNVHFYRGKNPPLGEIIDLAETLPFLAERRVFFLEDSGLFKSGGETLAEYLKSPAETAFFVFQENEVDKRSRLYKTVKDKGYAAEFPVQDEGTLKRWVARRLKEDGKQITEDTARLFLSRTGTNMDQISMELEKLTCYCMDRTVVTAADVEAVCTENVTNRIFEMINAIADQKTSRALELYYDLLALKEPPMRILFLLARQCNLLLQTKELKAHGFDQKSIAEKVGLTPYVAGKYLTQASKFKTAQLAAAIRRCVEAEEAIKTGRMDENVSLEVLLLTVFA